MIEGLYGILLLLGALTLLTLSAAHVVDSVNKMYSRMTVSHFVLLLLGLVIVFLAFPRGSLFLSGLAMGLLFLIQIPLAMFLLIESDVSRGVRRRKKEEALIAKFNTILEKEPESLYAAMGMASTLERYGDYLKAAEEYRALAARLPDKMFGFKAGLQRREWLARQKFEIDQKMRVYECGHCKIKNRPQLRLCAACGQPLHRNAFQWLWRSVAKSLKFGALAVILVSLLFCLALPPLYCLGLGLVWLTVILYFSLLNGLALSP